MLIVCKYWWKGRHFDHSAWVYARFNVAWF